jgi:carbonic anhydrase/acetyltransferase-like protein (isoleucine patch superfamily)
LKKLIHAYHGKSPKIAQSAFVAPSATIIGDVTLEEDASVWFGAVLRAESAPIRVGKHSNIQDNCVIHTDEGFPVDIGDGVSIGHLAVVHGARIGSNCLVGMSATLLNGATIGENSMVAAGSLVTQGASMPQGVLVLGSPAIAKRKLSEEEIERIRKNSQSYDKFRREYLNSSLVTS